MKITEQMKHRAKMLQSLPVSDWHQIIAFEKIVRNYMVLINKSN